MQRLKTKKSLFDRINSIRNMLKLKFIVLFASCLTWFASFGQITVTNVQTPEELVNDVLVGAGVIISNVEFNHSVPFAGAIQAQAGYFDATGTSFPIERGVLLATGNVRLAEGPNDSGSATDGFGVAPDPGDTDLAAIGTTTINDEAILEFDFIPSGDSVVFKYIFASEEYHEYSTSSFNDVFGFFISGPGFAGPYEFGGENIALIPGVGLPVTMNNLNNGPSNTGPCINCAYLVDNTGGVDVQYDAHTVIMYARAGVQCGELYHIKLAIGDAGDNSFDSGVFLEASSFSSNGITVEIASVLCADGIIEGCDSAIVTFIRPPGSDTTDLSVDFEIGGTAINGTDYTLLDETIFFPIGEDSVQIWIVPEDDGIVEGAETVTITVEIINACGDTITTEATIEIIDPLDFDIITTDISIECPEDSLLLTFDTDGGIPEFDVTWSSGGTELEEWVPGDLVGTTTYTVTVVDVCGVESIGTIDVIFDPAPVATLVFNEDLFIICPGQEADIDATVIGAYDPGAVTYEWAPTGETVEDITVSPAIVTWYYLTVFDGCNTIIDSVKVDFGTVDLTDITVVDAIDCPGLPSAVLGSISVEPDDPSWTYELIAYAPPQDNGFFPDLAGGIDYILTVTDENGCTIDTIVAVGLGENAVVATWAVDSLRDISCFGAADGGAYVFGIGGGITPPYQVTWTNLGGIFDVEPVLLGGSSEHDDLTGGTWVVTVTDQDGCAWSHSFFINEPDELTMDLIWNTPTCHGFSDGSITVNTSGGNGGEIYTMTDADGTQLNIENSNTINTLPTGTYYITVVDQNGCSVSGDFFLSEPGELDIEMTVSQPLCYGIETGFVQIDTVFNYTGDYDQIGYYWAPNPSGEDGIGKDFNNHLAAGEYIVTINDENGCSKVFDFTIVYPPELVFAEFGFDPAYCRLFDYQNGNGQVYAAATGGTPDYDTPQWTYLEDGTTANQGTWGGRNPGDYEVVIRDANGCVLRDTITVDSLNPIAAFDVISDQLNGDLKGTADVEVVFENKSLYFANILNPLADTTFFWNLDSPNGDWIISEHVEETMDTIYKAKGYSYEVEVCLVAMNKNGCTDTACKIITIFEPIAFDGVNIFSPNGDGVNDFFTFEYKSASIAELECIIVNRWGIKVGEINTPTGSWDGTDLNGSPCSDGVYFYTYVAKADNGEKLEGQGTIQIVGSK